MYRSTEGLRRAAPPGKAAGFGAGGVALWRRRPRWLLTDRVRPAQQCPVVSFHQLYPHRYGSGWIGPLDEPMTSIPPCALICPIRNVFAMWWFLPLIVTVPSGAANVTPPAAAMTFSGSKDFAFSTAAL